MHSTEWTKVLLVICTFCTFCTPYKSISHDNNHGHRMVEEPADIKSSQESKWNEAECIDLFKRRHNEQLLTRYWMFIESKSRPFYRHRCLKYLSRYLAQLKKKNSQQARLLLKRDISRDQVDRKHQEPGGRKLPSNGKEEQVLMGTTSSIAPFSVEKQAESSSGIKSQNNVQIPPHRSHKDTGLAAWVYVVIGIGVVIVISIPLAVTLIYYKKRLALRHELANPKPPREASDLMYDTQRSRSTDKGTERSKSTVSTYLSKDSRDVAECHELLPLRSDTRRKSLSLAEMFQKSEYNEYDQPLRRQRRQEPSYSNVIDEPDYLYDLNYSQHRDRRSSSRERSDLKATSSARYRQEHGDRLIGGNVDIHRSAGDQDDGYEISVCRPPLELARNESRSSSSTRSYISIPPTSPSENYIKAGLDDAFIYSEHHTALTKMAWLTKNLKGDSKNEFSSYHASSGTQTDSDSSITGPNCLTVFGTPWQFGGTFTSRGGVMQAKDSDVCLVVVPNAVPKGEYVDIYGAIFTDTMEIRKKLLFSSKETMITPVVEYHAQSATPFRRQLCVQLPHALPEEFDISLIRVYTFTVDEHGTVTLNNIPVSSKANTDIEAHWEKGTDGRSINISTTHFSGYFCTQCESTSWPSICTMVFGSHVQITQSRREVRVILYIWDHRLIIKDYLERFRKQESDVDRQLLTDMQVPLLDNASSDSRLIMCMEAMGGEDDRQFWRHILRPDGSRPLFKPLQVRKLSEIVHCCRQTDPIRVEWALENKPNQIPGAVFQCCIDVMHVHESTRDYETAMREDSDDLMRTFYVRDLKVMTNSIQEPEQKQDFQCVNLKRTLSETMDISQTERMCHEFGISTKDIGNFRKKYSTQEAFQICLVEECLRRHGPETFLSLLPKVLQRLHFTEVLTVLDDKKILARHSTDFTDLSDPPTQSVNAHAPQPRDRLDDDEGSTRHKSPYRRRSSTSPNRRNKSCSPPTRRKEVHCSTEGNGHSLEKEMSGRNSEVLTHKTAQHNHSKQTEQYNRSMDRESRQNIRHSGGLRNSPPIDYYEDNGHQLVNNHNTKHNVTNYTGQNTEERHLLKNQRSSSSGVDSVLGTRSDQSRGNTSASLSSHHTLGTSMYAHADPKDFTGPVSDEFLDSCLRQTYKKELLANPNLRGHYSSQDYTPYQNVREGHLMSDCGPFALCPESKETVPSSVSDPVPPYRPFMGDNVKVYNNSQKPDKEETSKKELFGTVV